MLRESLPDAEGAVARVTKHSLVRATLEATNDLIITVKANWDSLLKQ